MNFDNPHNVVDKQADNPQDVGYWADNSHNIVDKRADNPHSGDGETEVLPGAVPDAGPPPAVRGTDRDG